jgi:RNA 2',3'-cyclic 3'-phosphodiesterase
MTERLFFALWPDAPLRAILARLQKATLLHGGRPTHHEDFHLTLAFLGEVPAERRACCEAAADAVRAAPFGLRLERVGHWPRPRILWCGPQTNPPELLALVRTLGAALRPCGFAGEDRPYAAHLTLARKVTTPPAPLAAWHADWRVDSFVLAAGCGGQAPRYRVLRRWDLAGASPSPPLCDNARL